MDDREDPEILSLGERVFVCVRASSSSSLSLSSKAGLVMASTEIGERGLERKRPRRLGKRMRGPRRDETES
jgi:hypothetical protein